MPSTSKEEERVITVSDSDLCLKISETIDELDGDSLAALAEHLLGGEWFFNDSDDNYECTTNEDYCGAFG